MSEVKSLAELPNWGGGFPDDHEFSTLRQIRDWNDSDPLRPYDDALESADRILTRWADPTVRGGVGLYLHGTPGNGKTHFAVALGRALAEHNIDTAYLHVPTTTRGDYEIMARFMSQPVFVKDNSTPSSIFSYDVRIDMGRGTARGKSALILDDYRPQFQKVAHAAVEAAAEAGGLVIITSNHPDPFGLLTRPSESPKTDSEVAARAFIEHTNPGALAAEDAKRNEEAQAISASLASRMAAMFRMVEFSGPDMRTKNSFWN